MQKNYQPLKPRVLREVDINQRRYDFQQKRSTSDLLSNETHSRHKSLEVYGELQVVALDIYKEFDQACHRALLNKLSSYGFPLQLCTCINSFLSDWLDTVAPDGYNSNFH